MGGQVDVEEGKKGRRAGEKWSRMRRRMRIISGRLLAGGGGAGRENKGRS